MHPDDRQCFLLAEFIENSAFREEHLRNFPRSEFKNLYALDVFNTIRKVAFENVEPVTYASVAERCTSYGQTAEWWLEYLLKVKATADQLKQRLGTICCRPQLVYTLGLSLD
jgi:hypothetical protein